MSTTKSLKTTTRSRIQQSDITITPEGKVFISFLWDDLRELVGERPGESTALDAWAAPTVTGDFRLDEYQSCTLCPKECGFNRNRYVHPSCGDSKLRVSNTGISFGDEDIIKGQRGSGIIMLSGCPLTCPSCHNPEKVNSGRETTLQEFLDLCEALAHEGAENLQILSPTVHFPALRVALKILKDTHFPLPIIFKSSGYESVGELQKLQGLVDFYLPDFKFGPCSGRAERSGAKDYFEKTKAAVEEMIRQVGTDNVLIRHLKVPMSEREAALLNEVLRSFQTRVSIQTNYVELD